MERTVEQVTDRYRVADLSEEEEQKIRKLEEEIGCTLIAYDRKME